MSPHMVKNTSIWEFLGKLATTIGGEHFQVSDKWDADLCAIGIASTKDPKRLVYVCAWQKAPGRFAYECEMPTYEDDFAVAGRSEDASFEELVEIIRQHLRIES